MRVSIIISLIRRFGIVIAKSGAVFHLSECSNQKCVKANICILECLKITSNKRGGKGENSKVCRGGKWKGPPVRFVHGPKYPMMPLCVLYTTRLHVLYTAV